MHLHYRYYAYQVSYWYTRSSVSDGRVVEFESAASSSSQPLQVRMKIVEFE